MPPTHSKSLQENLEMQGTESINQDMTSMASKSTSAHDEATPPTDHFDLSNEECLLIQQDYAHIWLYTKDGGKPVFKAFSDTFTIQFFCLNNTVL